MKQPTVMEKLSVMRSEF